MPGDSIPVLSDHAYQSTRFQSIDPRTGKPVLELNVGSWNLQDKCFSKENHVNKLYANNPYDADETQDNFEIRKRAQIGVIEQKISNGGDDLIFLQEIDCLLGPNKALRSELKTMLQRHNYALELTHNLSSSQYTQQPMAIIYNAAKLRLQSSQGVFPAPPVHGKQKFRGYETTFALKDGTRRQIIATNLHLLYGHDYKTEIEDYQKAKEVQGVLTIMGGDTNNIQNANLNTALGDWHTPTNFSMDAATQRLTTRHDNATGSTTEKAYDRFFVVPPAGCYIKATPTERSEQVTINPTGDAEFSPITQFKTSTSRVGERWRRGKDIIKELETEFNSVTSTKDKYKLLKEMHSVVELKKLDDTKCFTDAAVQKAYQAFELKPPYDYYIPQSKRIANNGRFHLFKAETPGDTLKGDALKSKILDDFMNRIEKCQTLDELKRTIQQIKREAGYLTLATAQGLTTKLAMGLIKTSSIIAFETMCEDKRSELSGKTHKPGK